MPTINPRLSVTLPRDLADLVADFARLQRVSASQAVRDLLEASEPAIRRAVALMRAAQAAAPTARAELAAGLELAQDRAEAELHAVLGQLEGFAQDLVGQAAAVRGRRPSERGENPPPSNRGVKSPKRLDRKTGVA